MSLKTINVSILGGSGYAGGELMRILLNHPFVRITQSTSRQFANRSVTHVHPNLRKLTDLKFTSPDELLPCDLMFVALPNGESMSLMPSLIKTAEKIIDLGADFRLNDASKFEEWYGRKHLAPELLSRFVNGIAELHRQELNSAQYVSCAGCEATATILALHPLIKHGLIRSPIWIDAKMSSSQIGMKPSIASHHPERSGVVRSYMPTGHRHTAEIIQELQLQENFEVAISATAIDMVRGLLVTIHTVPKLQLTDKEIWQAYRAEYRNEPFIRIVKEPSGIYRYPEPKILQGTNFCDIGFELDPRANRLVIIAAIDNLTKGTAGQAVQAMNLLYGFPETAGLEFAGLHPI